MVSTRIPMTSSMMAALTMVVPTKPFSLPSSRSACTVILTEVAVMIQPIIMALSNSLVPKGANP